MSAYVPTNTFGGTLSIDPEDIKKEIKLYSDNKYLNELGDSMKGDLGMNNFIIKNVGNPVDDKDVVNKIYMNISLDKLNTNVTKLGTDLQMGNKKYIDDKMMETMGNKKYIDDKMMKLDAELNQHITSSSEVLTKLNKELNQHITSSTKALANVPLGNNIVIYLHILEKQKRKDYHSILEKYKPKFWLSAMFPFGFENTRNDIWDFQDLSGNGLMIREHPELTMDNEHLIAIYFNTISRIKSQYTFSNEFSFFILCRKADMNNIGRLITGRWGNIVIGFWNKYKDFVHINKKIYSGTLVEKTNLEFFVLRYDNKDKYIYYENVFGKISRITLVESLSKFDQIVLGKPTTFSKETQTGFIYECICFNYFIKDPDEIIDFIKRYYIK